MHIINILSRLWKKTSTPEQTTAREPAHPAIPAFQLEAVPEAFSEEWEQRQLRRFAEFPIYPETKRQLALWEEVLRFREAAFVQSLKDTPFVQAYLVKDLKWDHHLSTPYTSKDVRCAWVYCRVKRLKMPESLRAMKLSNLHLTPAQQQLADAFLEDFGRQEEEYQQAKEQLDQIRTQMEESIFARLRAEKDAAWAAYDRHMKTLRKNQNKLPFYQEYQRARADWDAALRYLSSGETESPFAFAGWPDYLNPEWPAGYQRTQGIAFDIDRASFGNREPILYYRATNRGIDDEKLYTETIEQYSRGIRVEAVDILDRETYNYRFTFRLEESQQDGGCMLMVPVSGEFNCELGELLEGHLFPLCHEHFLADSLYALQMDLRHSETDAPHDYRPQEKNIRY